MPYSVPPFCNIFFGDGGGPPSPPTGAGASGGTTGGPPAGVSASGGTGGPPSGVSASGGTGGPPAGVGTIDLSSIPMMGLIDTCFEPKPGIEFTILGLVIIFYIPSIILYIKNRNHLLIKYRQPIVVLVAAILNAIMSILVPLYRYYGVSCYVNTWTINLLVFSSCIITYSRYVRGYYIQRLSIFKLKFGERKNSSRKKEKRTTVNIKSKEMSLSQQWEASTLKTSSVTKGSSVSNDGTFDSFGITDPTLYFKRLNQIINKKLIIILVIVPIIFIFIYSIYITVKDDNGRLAKTCVNEDRSVGTPKLILSIVICISSIFLFYQAYIKQKWDIEIKVEYTIFIIGLIICNVLMQLTVREYLSDNWRRYRIYIFHFFTAVIHFITIVLPLSKIYIDKIRNQDDKLTEEEFISKLSNSNFKAQVKEIATNTFCIENVLFFEAHQDLMNMVISYYSKRNNFTNPDSSFNSSDILHRNTLNPMLYKNFESIFKPQFEQVYNLYIREDGIAAINIKSTTIKTIEEQMENDNFSYLMFSQAAEEVGELLYSNIYPRMKEPDLS